MASKGLQILYNLILKGVAKESVQASGILSIGKDIRKLADKKLQRYITAAKKQGVDLDNLSEEQAKYMLELNKPKAPTVLSNEEAYKFLNEFLKQGKKDKGKVIEFPRDKITDWTKSQSRPPETEIIKGIETTRGLGDLFPKQLEKTVTVRTVIEDIKKMKPIDSMKETNKVLKGEGKYKNLSKADREKIAGDESVTDHIFERNIIDETEDFAQGGPAGLSYLLAEDTNERMPLAGGGYLPMGMWGDIAEAFEKYQEENKDSVGPLMSYKQFWNNYIDNLASGGRVGYAGGGSGKPPINFYVNFAGSGGKEGQDIYGVKGLNEKGYNYGGTFAADTTFPFLGGELSVGGELGIGRNKRNVDYNGQPIYWLSGVGETKLGDDWNVGMKWRKKFGSGGMGRRTFLKLMAALGLTGASAKYGLPTLFKRAAPKAVKDLTEVPIKNIDGMPAWFKPLVNKVIKEGEDVTKQWAYKERQVVHKTKLPDSQTDVLVTQDLDSGDVLVDIGLEKHGFASGKFGQPVRLEYKAKEIIEPDIDDVGKVKSKGQELPEEFNVEEAEFTGGHPENVKFEEVSVNKFGKHESDFSEVEAFAKGKKKKGVRNVSESFDKMNEDIADRFANYPRPDDYASGGIAKMLGE